MCTFILEDPTTVGSGLLVADGRMAYWAAFLGLSIGIAAGDFGLYLCGGLAQGWVRRRGLLDSGRLQAAGRWFDRNVVTAVLAARFIPGMRLPTYLAAGVLKVSAARFLAVAVGASVIWTYILLNLTVRMGEAMFDHLGRLKVPVGLAVVVFLAVLQWLLARHFKKDKPVETEPAFRSFFEFWPPIVFYFPVVMYCAYLAIRHRGMMLFSVSNPLIYSGGLLMESKSGILDMVPEEHRRWLPSWAVYHKTGNPGSSEEDLKQALLAMAGRGVDFPIVAKPDVGQRGFGVRPVYDQAQLEQYLSECAPDMKIILQKMAPYSAEAGVLYYRRPGEDQGHIISITQKYFPYMVGDGKSTLRELILADRRAKVTQKVFFRRHRKQLDRVPEEGEIFKLVFAGDHAQGCVFLNGTSQATPAMLERLHEIATSIPEFYFGRFDIRCQSFESLQRGEDFLIVEINGAGGEPTHIWDPRTRLRDAYRDIFQQYRLIYEIGAVNRRRGFKPMTLTQLLTDHFNYKKMVKYYPLTH